MSRATNPNAQRPLPGAQELDPNAWQARPRQPQQPQHPSYAQPAHAPQGEAPAADPYAQQGYHYPQGGQPQAGAYAQQPGGPLAAAQARTAAAYAAQYDPYAPAPQPQSRQPQSYAAQGGYSGHPAEPTLQQPRNYDAWAAAAPAADHRGLDPTGYGQAAPAGYDAGRLGQQHARAAEWGAPDPYAAHAGEPTLDPSQYATYEGQPAGLEQTYAEDDAAYAHQGAEPRRGRKLAIVLASAMLIGGGLAYAYSALLGPSSDGAPAVVKNTDGPFKVKPSDPGGKQFAHSDSKIMGRLAEGSDASADVDPATGARKVPVLAVGRDGSIEPPATQPASQEAPSQVASVSVPGLMVIDGLDGQPGQQERPQRQSEPEVADAPPAAKVGTSKKVTTASEPTLVNPSGTAKKPVVIAKVTPRPETTQSISDDAPAAPAATTKPKKTAAVAPAAPAAETHASGAGYVAVLASVPASNSSRMDALKRFADMQQKYGNILHDKTPDVQEANLGEKGIFHRLLVGPPGSRVSATELCTQLKAQGYTNCWVTAY